MTSVPVKKTISTALLVVFVALMACGALLRPAGALTSAAPQTITITISPTIPSDIPGGAQSATLSAASAFAWQEFIALNWPAVNQTGQLNTRDTADATQKFGDPNFTGPLVWHTFRAKDEIFPGQNVPHGYVNSSSQSYGYDNPPQYVYKANTTASQNNPYIIPANGVIPPTGSPDPATPWINLDENSQIGLDYMFAGNAPTTQPVGQQALFLAKANRIEYNYVAANGWWTQKSKTITYPNGQKQTIVLSPPLQATAEYVMKEKQSPPPGGSNLVGFNYGTIEVKSAWRRLNTTEINRGQFYMTKVRYYIQSATDGPITYNDDTFGLVSLHIIQKTPTAPYFIYATFEQTNNLLDANGNPIEDANGNVYPQYQNLTPMLPNISSQNATGANPASPQSIQVLSPSSYSSSPSKQAYYQNLQSALPQGTATVQKREHNIPTDVINVNAAAHSAIMQYDQANGITKTPWLSYKLVNVQYQPYDKPAGTTYTNAAPGGPDPSTYYQSNSMVETDYNLQVFSGQFQGFRYPFNWPVAKLRGLPLPGLNNNNTSNLITDYNVDGTAFKNVYYSHQGYNMGGCMGCHGNASVAGADFSFILKFGPDSAPDYEAGPGTGAAAAAAAHRRRLIGTFNTYLKRGRRGQPE